MGVSVAAHTRNIFLGSAPLGKIDLYNQPIDIEYNKYLNEPLHCSIGVLYSIKCHRRGLF